MYNLIEDYLDRMTVPLVHRVPYHERQRIRQEVRDHLLERVQELTAQGVSADEAVAVVLRQFGSPEWVGTLLLEKRQPVARLNWWRAILLILIIGATSLSLTQATYWKPSDPRQQMMVDAMLWTAGERILLSPGVSQELPDWSVVYSLPFSIPPLSVPRPVPDLSLRPLGALIEQNYGEWLTQRLITRHRRAESPSIQFVPELSAGGSFGVLERRRLILPSSVCGSSGCFAGSNRPAAGSIASWVAGSLMVCALLTGLIMRRGRWVAITALASVAVSLMWCAMAVQEIGYTHIRQQAVNAILNRVVVTLEKLAQREDLFLRFPTQVPLQQMGLSSNAERPQRILQLAKLYRYYQSDYERMWQEWRQLGTVGQMWRVFRVGVVPVWWTVPLAVVAVTAGGWLGILLGIWGWRWRRYLVYRYV